MKKYYKVKVFSEYSDLSHYNQNIIVERGLIYAREIATDVRIMICDTLGQGKYHDYYVLSTSFKTENIARYEEIEKYLADFKMEKFPMYSKMEAKKAKKLVNKFKMR